VMENSRRRFLEIAGISALGLGEPRRFSMPGRFGGGQRGAGYHDHAKGEDALTAKQWAMVIDTRKLQTAEDLEPIIEACTRSTTFPRPLKTRTTRSSGSGSAYHNAFPEKTTNFLDEEVEHRPFLVLCNHCENPPCVRPAPPRRPFKRRRRHRHDGFPPLHRLPLLHGRLPLRSPELQFRDPRPFIEETTMEFPTRMKGVVEKCNFCAERLAVGKDAGLCGSLQRRHGLRRSGR
jgi:Fe-S-cluster-containing dehydrogenase component